jgi:flagellar protein FlbD
MITLHRLNGSEFILNDHHIETLEATPDTVITLVNEKKYIVKESTEQVINEIVAFQRQVCGNLPKKES